MNGQGVSKVRPLKRAKSLPTRCHGIPIEGTGVKGQPQQEKHDCERGRMARRLSNRSGPVLLSEVHITHISNEKGPVVNRAFFANYFCC